MSNTIIDVMLWRAEKWIGILIVSKNKELLFVVLLLLFNFTLFKYCVKNSIIDILLPNYHIYLLLTRNFYSNNKAPTKYAG